MLATFGLSGGTTVFEKKNRNRTRRRLITSTYSYPADLSLRSSSAASLNHCLSVCLELTHPRIQMFESCRVHIF